MVDDDEDHGPFKCNMAQFIKFWYAGEEGETRRLKAMQTQVANGSSEPDVVLEVEGIEESGPGGNNGKRAVIWDYFDLKSQKHWQHRNKAFATISRTTLSVWTRSGTSGSQSLDQSPCRVLS